MGTIKVGQKNQKTVDMGGFTVAPNNNGATTEKKNGMTAEEKAKLIEEIMQLPHDQIVPELRKRGFNEIADITEAQMKQVQQKQSQVDARDKRLAEIMAMPVEEQLPLLLAEGYEDEAKELSERLAAEQNVGQKKTDDGTGEAPESAEAPAEEPEKKKRGTTTKKTTSKK